MNYSTRYVGNRLSWFVFVLIFLPSHGIYFSFSSHSGKKETIFLSPGKNTISTIHVSPWTISTSIMPSAE